MPVWGWADPGEQVTVSFAGQKHLATAGTDGKYIAAEATIDGETVVVRSTGVTAPAAVRYTWSHYLEGCNLYNAAGLPAAPFRTDRKSP